MRYEVIKLEAETMLLCVIDCSVSLNVEGALHTCMRPMKDAKHEIILKIG